VTEWEQVERLALLPALERLHLGGNGLTRVAYPAHLIGVPDPDGGNRELPFQRLKALLLGRAVRVDPIKPTLKTPGSHRLKLEYDEMVSNFACKFNLRRYSWVTTSWAIGSQWTRSTTSRAWRR